MKSYWIPCGCCGEEKDPHNMRWAYVETRQPGERVTLICGDCADGFHFDEGEGLLVRTEVAA